MTVSAPAPATLIVPPERAEDYLLQLGIPMQAVLQAAELGELRAADIDKFHPRGAAGVTRWIGTVGELRRRMVDDRQWTRQDKLNRPTVERADGKVTLSVVGCDEATGDSSSVAGPRAANRRGPATIAAVNDQLELISVAALVSDGTTVVSIDDDAPLGQWFVLYHRSRDKDQVLLEVSKAAGIAEEGEGRKTGQFTGWMVRVILEPYQPEPEITGRRPLDVGGDDVDFTIVAAS